MSLVSDIIKRKISLPTDRGKTRLSGNCNNMEVQLLPSLDDWSNCHSARRCMREWSERGRMPEARELATIRWASEWPNLAAFSRWNNPSLAVSSALLSETLSCWDVEVEDDFFLPACCTFLWSCDNDDEELVRCLDHTLTTLPYIQMSWLPTLVSLHENSTISSSYVIPWYP